MSNVFGAVTQSGVPMVRPMFRTLGIAASGLSAQRQRMEVIASNIANAETTRTDAGTPYRRKVAQLEARQAAALPGEARAAGDPLIQAVEEGPVDGLHGVKVSAIVEDPSEGPLVYDPGHPDADATGYVRYPNVRITEELVDLMDARRVYEANATVFQAVKSMLRSSLEL